MFIFYTELRPKLVSTSRFLTLKPRNTKNRQKRLPSLNFSLLNIIFWGQLWQYFSLF